MTLESGGNHLKLSMLPIYIYKMYYVYILKCNDGDFYKGCTTDLNDRYNRHLRGWVPATADKLPIVLIFYCAFVNKYKAYDFEKYLKSGSGIAFMQKRFI